jgi:cell division septation protein DedD
VAAAPPPARAAAPVANATGGYVVQVSSQRSEAEAHAAYQALQSRHPSILRNHRHIVRRVALGDRGTFYRALVGPFASAGEADRLCGSLKSAGASCIIQRN